MPCRYKRSLFLFHRDLRLHDNRGLLAACRSSEQVIPCFIFDSRQITNNPYRGELLINFMHQCLHSLQGQLVAHNARLYLFSGISHEIVETLIMQEKIEAIFSNRDYTPFAQSRDQQIESVCKNLGATLSIHADALLNEPEDSLKADGTPYTIFTPFWKRSAQRTVEKPERNDFKNFYTATVAGEVPLPVFTSTKDVNIQGGREQCKELLKNLSTLTDYSTIRDIPEKDGTSKLSAYNKFGCCSIREVFYCISKALGPAHPLLRQLYWRDFFTHIAFHFPHVFTGCFHKEYDALPWENDEDRFQRWKNGTTGFPFIDAGMRELRATGIMHNRARMVVASFLVKDLHIDWRWGEKHFAQYLIDYDPAVNNGNWQWAASTGCDAQPYFRVFNPWIQQQKFDPECSYIKRWIPELRPYSAKQIHAIEKSALSIVDYPQPIVNHAEEKAWSEENFSEIKDTK